MFLAVIALLKPIGKDVDYMFPLVLAILWPIDDSG